MGTTNGTLDTTAILREGRVYVLDDYAQKDQIYSKVKRVFFEGIESIEGRGCRDRVEADGLARMHEHFPVEKVAILEHYLLEKLQDDLYYWSFKVGREDLGLQGTFYVDHLIVMRIHYPYLVARKAKAVQVPARPLRQKLRLGAVALKNWRVLINAVGKLGEPKQTSYDAEAYHKKLPGPARAHGAHIDTWYGHSYDGINLWWSIDGVNEDNTVILYPDLFGHVVPFDPVSMYLAEGYPITRPHKVSIKPGQLLVFNPEMLHGTQVNISDETRIVISTRLNPETPRFDPNAAWHLEHWVSSKDLEKKKFSSIVVFPAKKYFGKPSFEVKPGSPAQLMPRVHCAGKLSRGEARAVCAAAEVPDGQCVAVDFENSKLFVRRDGQSLRAFTRICPHLAMDLIGGYDDGKQIFCPGHGVAYSLEDGSSRCPAFKLRQYDVFEQDGTIYVRHAGKSDREADDARPDEIAPTSTARTHEPRSIAS